MQIERERLRHRLIRIKLEYEGINENSSKNIIKKLMNESKKLQYDLQSISEKYKENIEKNNKLYKERDRNDRERERDRQEIERKDKKIMELAKTIDRVLIATQKTRQREKGEREREKDKTISLSPTVYLSNQPHQAQTISLSTPNQPHQAQTISLSTSNKALPVSLPLSLSEQSKPLSFIQQKPVSPRNRPHLSHLVTSESKSQISHASTLPSHSILISPPPVSSSISQPSASSLFPPSPSISISPSPSLSASSSFSLLSPSRSPRSSSLSHSDSTTRHHHKKSISSVSNFSNEDLAELANLAQQNSDRDLGKIDVTDGETN
jgi:hypothetical protein